MMMASLKSLIQEIQDLSTQNDSLCVDVSLELIQNDNIKEMN